MSPQFCVVDTMILQKANAQLENKIKNNRDIAKRIALLKLIYTGKYKLLISKKLRGEYDEHTKEKRNDFVKLFFAILSKPSGEGFKENWPEWHGHLKERMQGCRFPPEDEHVLRTAYLQDSRSKLFTEEGRILKCAACTNKHFKVRLVDPRKDDAKL